MSTRSLLGLALAAAVLASGQATLPAQKDDASFWAAYAEASQDPVRGFAKKKELVSRWKTRIPFAITYKLLLIAGDLEGGRPEKAAAGIKLLEDLARMYQLIHRDKVLWRRVEFARGLDAEKARTFREAYDAWVELSRKEEAEPKTPQTVEERLLAAQEIIGKLEEIGEDFVLGDVAFLAGQYCLLKEDYEEAAKFFDKAKLAFGRNKRHERENYAALELQKLERQHGVGVGRGAKPRRERRPRREPTRFPPVSTRYVRDKGPWTIPSPNPANFYDHMLWRGLDLAKHKPVTWPLGDGSVVVWEGGSKLFLDLDNSGKKRRRLKAAAGTQAVAEVPVKYARSRGKYRLILRALGEEKFLGYGVRYGGRGLALRMARACHREATFQGLKIALVDENLNAKYDDYGVDLIRVGRDIPQPLSRVVNLAGKLYGVSRVKPDGTEIVFEEYVAESGKLRVEWQGARGVQPTFLVFQLTRGEFPNTYVNAAGGKEIEVPVGFYQFAYGIVSRGSGRKLQFVRLRTGRAETFEVEEGKTTTIRMGAPFDALAAIRRGSDPGELVVPGPEIKVFGAHGEEYLAFYPDSFKPRVTIRLQGGHKVAEKLLGRPSQDVLDRDRKRGVGRAWFPADLRFKGPADRTYEVRIAFRHPLLGVVKGQWHPVTVGASSGP